MDEAEIWRARYEEECLARLEAEKRLEAKGHAIPLEHPAKPTEGAERSLGELDFVRQAAPILAHAVRHTGNPVFITDVDDRIVWANGAFADLFGYAQAEYLGKSPEELLQLEENQKEVRPRIQPHLDAYQPFTVETLNYDREGKPIWVFSQATPVFDETGKFVSYVTFQTDITATLESNHRLEKEKQRANQMAQRAERANVAKTKFLATMSHELRTPLNGIIGYAQILEKTRSAEARDKDKVEIIRRSGEHLLSLINDLLDVSKIESGEHRMFLSRFDLEAFLNSVLEIINAKAQEKKLELNSIFATESFIPPQSRVYVESDPRALRQVLLNLLGNAIKFTDQGSVTLEARFLGYDGARARIRIAVIDTGRGIPPEMRKHLFDAFKQVDEESDAFQGTGLGLFIAQQLVMKLGGEITVEANPKGGTCFSFILACPLDHEPIQTDVVSEEQARRSTKHPTSYRGRVRSILIVDDIKDNRSLLTDLLAPLNFKLNTAENGREALHLLKASRYDLVLSDLIMPFMNGYDLAKAIRADPKLKATCILAVSANVMSLPEADQSRMQDFDGFVGKPVQFEELLNALQQHLGLAWNYDHGKRNRVTATAQETNDSAAEPTREDLLWHARIGDIAELRRMTKAIQTTQPALSAKLRPLLRQFKLKELVTVLATETENQDSP